MTRIILTSLSLRFHFRGPSLQYLTPHPSEIVIIFLSLFQSEPRLKSLSEKSDIALNYCSLVLFPETFIHSHMVSQGGGIWSDFSVEFLIRAKARPDRRQRRSSWRQS